MIFFLNYKIYEQNGENFNFISIEHFYSFAPKYVVNVQNDEILDIEHFFVHFVPKKVQLH